MDESDDQRDTELGSLSAIFPEIQLDARDPHRFSLEVPVHPSEPVVVYFPAPASAPVDNPEARALGGQIDSHGLSHLPAVRLDISLPKGYPEAAPPDITISTSPPWLPAEVSKRLGADATRLWEEMGRDSVVFTYIDHVQQEAENVFGLVGEKGNLEVDAQHKIAILDYDIKATRAAFEKETFECGVCLDPKKGSVCHRMLDCGHVFCVQCLQDFYNNAITEGDLASVRCLEPTCAKERGAATAGKKRRKPKTFISPSELLQIPLDHDMVTRYVTLKYKTELESDKNTIYCPRSWCNGAARSKRHKKPEGFELAEASGDSDSEEEPGPGDQGGSSDAKKKKAHKVPETADLLAICEDCGFAFCSRCFQTWHGEFYRCTPRRDKGELTAEEQASLEYMQLHTTPCPTCAAPAQKTHGCNHMICYRCQSHFCYLCSAWLDPGNPYQHFNQAPDGRVTGCYMRLWELEGGDGDDVGYNFAGGPGPAPPPPPHAAAAAQLYLVEPRAVVVEIEEPEDGVEGGLGAIHEGVAADGGNGRRQDDGQAGRAEVAREGPLVLRIAAEQPPRRDQAVPPPAAPAPPGPGARHRGGQVANRAPPHQQQQQPGGAAGPRRGGGRGPPAGQAGGRGRGGGGGHRQNQNQNHQINQRHHNANGARNGQGAAGRGGAAAAAAAGPGQVIRGEQGANIAPVGGGVQELNEAQQAWVRHFVQLALDDNEDLVESDSDEDEELIFWPEGFGQ